MAGENINTPQRRSIRLKGYGYSQAGAYFITVYTQNHEHLLGEISDAEMLINAWGNIIQECWYDLPNHYPGLKLDIFVVMPNHMHGIIIINDTNRVDNIESDTEHRVPTYEQFGKSIPNSISTIIRSYKSAVTKKINELRKTYNKKIWQPRFYDRIIRNEKELNKIRKYIINNPLKWQYDKENLNNIPIEEKRKFWKFVTRNSPQAKK